MPKTGVKTVFSPHAVVHKAVKKFGSFSQGLLSLSSFTDYLHSFLAGFLTGLIRFMNRQIQLVTSVNSAFATHYTDTMIMATSFYKGGSK